MILTIVIPAAITLMCRVSKGVSYTYMGPICSLMCFRFLFGFAGKATCIIKNKEITYVLNVNQTIDLFLDLTFQCKM